MRSGAAFLLAVLLGIFLAAGQCGSSSADDHDDDSHSSSSASDDNGDDENDGDDKDKDDESTDESTSESTPEQDSGHAEAMKQQLEGEGLQVVQMSSTTDDDCAAHSYGEVSDYFAEHPCQGLERAWYEVSDDQDHRAVLSVAWVRMPDDQGAADLQEVVDRPGTGNVTELSTQDGPYQDVGYGGRYYRSGRDGDTFYSVQAEPLADDQGSQDVASRASGATDPS